MSKKQIKVYLCNYNEEMGEIEYPEGFEEQLKKFSIEPFTSHFDKGFKEDDAINIIDAMTLIESNINNQMRCFGWSKVKNIPQWDDERYYSETPDNSLIEYIEPLVQDRDHIHLIMKDGIIVGVVIEGIRSFGDVKVIDTNSILFPGQGYIYDSSSDNNGAGYKTRKWYKYLVCLPHNHTLW